MTERRAIPGAGPPIDRVAVEAYRVPTDRPEADGTIDWDATTLVLARVHAGGAQGLGYTYTDAAATALIDGALADCLDGRDAFDIGAAWGAMNATLRNTGRPGLGLMAVSAVDHALWDLKGRLLQCAVATLLGQAQDEVEAYGSGGFTSYDIDTLQRQLAGWADAGLSRVKMKVGSHPHEDAGRVHAAREAIGPDVGLMVDANGAYDRKQALALAERFAGEGVDWFEEPVSSDDLEGLRLLRDRVPAGMEVTAGEYGWDNWYFRRMLQAGAVDVLQVDATRCGGFTGFLQAAALAKGFGVPLSAHCAPALHAHVCSALGNVRHLEYFHDHVRIERMFFDGAPVLAGGCLVVDRAHPGLGLTLKEDDVRRYRL